MNRTLKELILAAEFAAIISVLSQMTIPFGLVPLTGQTFAIGLTATFLGRKLGLISVGVYLLLGLIGLPVFSGMTGGIAVLFGPTGGYLIGFIFLTLIAGLLMKLFPGNKVMEAVGLVLGTVVCYAFGTAWLCFQAHMSAAAGLAAGVIPYIPGDLVKIVVAMIVGTALRAALKKAR